ncbi:MAG: hypothetical protein IJV97_03015 [Alphaproteobacteria bacterium]|nr:hypothetical protein [Alphaproteobacteria bacterium]
MKNFNKEEALVKFRNYAEPRNITLDETTIALYKVVIKGKSAIHEAVKAISPEGWVVNEKSTDSQRKFHPKGSIIVTPFKGSVEDMKKAKARKPEYVPALTENQDFDPHYNPDSEYPTRRVSSW